MRKIQILALVWMIGFAIIFQPYMVMAKQAAHKDEVIYASLYANGDIEDIYVVNSFDIKASGEYTDYGTYASVENLTDLSAIEQRADQVHFTADVGKFHYEGKLVEQALPWDFSVSYYLDGKEIEPARLAGASGNVEIALDVKDNEALDTDFPAYYLLQISLNLPIERTDNIVADGAAIASAGQDKQVTFTVMPGDDDRLTTSFLAHDFEMEGIQIAAVPATFDMDLPDVDEMQEEMGTLVRAIASIDKGTADLANGLASYHQGTKELVSGSGTFQAGLHEATDGIVSAVDEMDHAFADIDQVIGQLEGIDFDQFLSYIEEITSFTNAFDQMIRILENIRDNLAGSQAVFDDLFDQLPTQSITAEDLEALYESDADPEVIDRLIEAYEATERIREILTDADGDFTETIEALDEIINEMKQVRDDLDDLSHMLDLLAEGKTIEEQIDEMTQMFGLFKDGMGELRSGMVDLADGYSSIHQGIIGLSDGSASLSSGAFELSNGTHQLAEATKHLPEEMTAQIDELLADYDFSDYEVGSFTSEQNKTIRSVQFVLKTKSITIDDGDDDGEPEPVKKSLWEKFLDLFRK